MIDGVKLKKLKVIPDARGRLMEVLRCDDDFFMKFGQAYITTAYPGVVKGWHYHKKQIDNFAVVRGMMKVVLYDGREESPTRGEVNQFFMGEHNPQLVSVPREVLHGFKCVGDTEAMILNCPTEPYNFENPDEYRVDPYHNDIPYDWDDQDG